MDDSESSIHAVPLGCPTCHLDKLIILGVAKEGLFFECLSCKEHLMVDWEELARIVEGLKSKPKKGNGRIK